MAVRKTASRWMRNVAEGKLDEAAARVIQDTWRDFVERRDGGLIKNPRPMTARNSMSVGMAVRKTASRWMKNVSAGSLKHAAVRRRGGGGRRISSFSSSACSDRFLLYPSFVHYYHHHFHRTPPYVLTHDHHHHCYHHHYNHHHQARVIQDTWRDYVERRDAGLIKYPRQMTARSSMSVGMAVRKTASRWIRSLSATKLREAAVRRRGGGGRRISSFS